MIWKLLDATGLVTERAVAERVSVEAVPFFCAVAGDSADLNLNAFSVVLFSVEMTEAASNSQHDNFTCREPYQ
jgi:hypothetical protein